jgi:hypothetical protein
MNRLPYRALRLRSVNQLALRPCRPERHLHRLFGTSLIVSAVASSTVLPTVIVFQYVKLLAILLPSRNDSTHTIVHGHHGSHSVVNWLLVCS